MNASTFYGPRKARENTTACDIPSGSEDSDLSDSDDDYPPAPQTRRIGTFAPGVILQDPEDTLQRLQWSLYIVEWLHE
ncbi:hypothetical protein HPB50_017909 [Hyalomma asiaticum]|uniref:Uncharacterized protein n=1 Tax=Hyalomma asiaticum TaxID=266040 RepID=A0ACB7RX21_HYAAI|nr:hypothetical protein HPB50_017909 [Hyalomma asiaticum]